MKRVVLFIILIGFLSCKKEVSKRSIKEIKQSATISKETKDTLSIIGNKIWIRESPKTGKVVLKLDDKTVCTVLEKGIKDTIKEQIDFWYRIKFYNQEGWVFGSQTTKSITSYVQDQFKPFVKGFLNNCFVSNNTDSLLRYKSPIVYKYIDKEIGFTRFHNPGVTCVPQSYNDQNYLNENNPKITLRFFTNTNVVKGFCEESTSKNGVYYHYIKELPNYPIWDNSEDGYTMHAINLPKNVINNPKMEVLILHKQWIIKLFYFIKKDNTWHLVLSNDCDCSA